MRALRDIRVIPVVIVAVAGLAVLKITGLLLEGGYAFSYVQASSQPASEPAWAVEAFNFPNGRGNVEITGSVPAKPEPAPQVKAPETSPPQQNAFNDPAPVSASERAVLERLQSRRQELEARARAVDIRESLLKDAEKRIGGKVEELKSVEGRIAAVSEQKVEADNARFKALVTMYEGMKPKDAAKVFDRLEMGVLIEIASQIAPRKMADILGLMSTEAAERLTVELARRASGKSMAASSELPKIEGRPIAPRN